MIHCHSSLVSAVAGIVAKQATENMYVMCSVSITVFLNVWWAHRTQPHLHCIKLLLLASLGGVRLCPLCVSAIHYLAYKISPG